MVFLLKTEKLIQFFKTNGLNLHFILYVFVVNDMSMSTIRRRHTEAERNVNRLRNCMPDKFTTLVKMHLSFMLDLDGSKFDEMFTDKSEKTEAPTKRKSSTPFSKKSHKGKV